MRYQASGFTAGEQIDCFGMKSCKHMLPCGAESQDSVDCNTWKASKISELVLSATAAAAKGTHTHGGEQLAAQPGAAAGRDALLDDGDLNVGVLRQLVRARQACQCRETCLEVMRMTEVERLTDSMTFCVQSADVLCRAVQSALLTAQLHGSQ